MSSHRNAKLGLVGRHALVRAVEGGMSLKATSLACAGSSSGSPQRVGFRNSVSLSDSAGLQRDRINEPHASPQSPHGWFETCDRESGPQ